MTTTDDIGRASEIAMRTNAESERRVRLAAAPERVADGVGGWTYQTLDKQGLYPFPDCVECGEPNIPARLALGRIRCIDCQSRREILAAKRR